MGIFVNVDNYARAEVALQADRLATMTGGEMNAWFHFREPTPLDKQNVIRMNRDTLYSLGIVDITEGATLTMPDDLWPLHDRDGDQRGRLSQSCLP